MTPMDSTALWFRKRSLKKNLGFLISILLRLQPCESTNQFSKHTHWLHSQFPSRPHHPRRLLVASGTSKPWITLPGIFIHILGSKVTSPSSWLLNLHVSVLNLICILTTKTLFFSRTPRKESLSRSLILSIELFRPKAGLELCGPAAVVELQRAVAAHSSSTCTNTVPFS